MKTIKIRSTADNVHYLVVSHVTDFHSRLDTATDPPTLTVAVYYAGNQHSIDFTGAAAQSFLDQWEEIENPNSLSSARKEVLAARGGQGQ